MDAKLNIPDISALLAKRCDIPMAKAELFSKIFFDTIIEGLEKDGLVKINGLGTFKIIDVASRGSVNVNTGEKIEIKGHRKITFLPSDTLKENVNEAFAMFEPVEVNENYIDDTLTVAPEAVETDSIDDIDETESEKETPICDSSNEPSIAAEESADENENDNIGEKNITETNIIEKNNITDSQPQNDVDRQNNDNTPNNEIVIEKKRGKTAFICFLSILLLIVIGVFWLFNGTSDVVETENYADKKEITTIVPEKNIADTLILHKKENVDKKETNNTFVLLDELEQISLSAITLKDTLLYKSVGNITVHKVGIDETLTKIALKYYNNKKLWPYLVKYNNMDNHNQLEIGMELLIPNLVPRN